MSTAFLLALTLAGGTLGAQSPAPQPSPTVDVDVRWAQWLGCWRLEDDMPGAGLRMCISAEQTSDTRWATLVGAQRGTVDVVRPDGAPHDIVDDDCTGSERSEWSANGLRLYRFTKVTCGKEPARTLSTVSFLRPGPVLVSVQTIEGGFSRSVRVQRYHRAADQTLADGTRVPLASPRLAATAPAPADAWTVDEVIEASGKLLGDAVQAALIQSKGPFALNKKTLVAMGDAGVAPAVIDLMVAMTYPKRFVIDNAGSPGSGYGGIAIGGMDMGGWYDPLFSPIVPAQYFFADCYSPFGYAYSSYYYPCRPYYSAWGYGGYYPGYYPPYGGGWVDVSPTPPIVPGTPPPDARVVNGRGYTQVRPRDPEPAPVLAGTNRGNNAGSSSGSNSGTSSGGSNGVSTGGYSSGGGADTGRTAVPRPPGGGKI